MIMPSMQSRRLISTQSVDLQNQGDSYDDVDFDSDFFSNDESESIDLPFPPAPLLPRALVRLFSPVLFPRATSPCLGAFPFSLYLITRQRGEHLCDESASNTNNAAIALGRGARSSPPQSLSSSPSIYITRSAHHGTSFDQPKRL